MNPIEKSQQKEPEFTQEQLDQLYDYIIGRYKAEEEAIRRPLFDAIQSLLDAEIDG